VAARSFSESANSIIHSLEAEQIVLTDLAKQGKPRVYRNALAKFGEHRDTSEEI